MVIQDIMHPIPKILVQNADLYNVLHCVCNNIPYKIRGAVNNNQI